MRLGRTLIDAATLQEGVARLATQIDRAQDGRPLLLVGILKGSIFFLCDLAKKLQTPVSVDFLQVSSYGKGTKSSGNVQLQRDLTTDVAGREILIVEDIVDTGTCIKALLDLLEPRRPASLRVCTLLDKPQRREIPVPIDYVGFEVPDRFIVGYGIDWAENFRELPYVGTVDPGGTPS